MPSIDDDVIEVPIEKSERGVRISGLADGAGASSMGAVREALRDVGRLAVAHPTEAWIAQELAAVVDRYERCVEEAGPVEGVAGLLVELELATGVVLRVGEAHLLALGRRGKDVSRH